MKERIKKKGKRVLAFVLVFAMVLGVAPFSIGNEVKAASEPTLKETVVFSDTFDDGTSWNTSAGNWRLGSTSHANLVGVRNGTAPLGYTTSTRNLYDAELSDVHVGADVRVTKAECYGSNLQYHFIFARGNTLGINSVAFGLKTTKNANKSSLVVGYYNGNDSITIWHETEAVYDINTTYALDLYVVGSLVMAKCNDQTVYLEEQTGISATGYCGITDRRATSNSAGTTYGTDYTKAGYFDNFTIGTVEEVVADGFKINGPVVIAKDGTGVADITLVTNGVDGATIDDAVVKVDALKNQAPNLYEGEYTVSTTISGGEKTSIATRVFVVDDLSKTVTKMNDSRWTGASATATPKFTVDANGKATLTPSGSAATGISTLNVGAANGAYGDFYAEYTLTMTDLAAEARGFVDSFLCMGSYGNPDSNAWGANLFFDNRASQAPNSTFWARLRMSDGSVNQIYSNTFADPDIEGGKPTKIGMLVYDNTITLLINGVEAATYTGTEAYKGWFGIAQSGMAGKTTIENFVYIPLEKKVVSVEFDAPQVVTQGETVEVKATPTYNWPYGVGEKTAQGVLVEGLDTSTDGEKNYFASFEGVKEQLTITITKKPDGFHVNGPVVMTKDGKGIADISILSGTVELETKEDVEVTVTGLDNLATGLYEGSYEVVTNVSGTLKTSIATRVFVVNDLSKAVTSMSDSRWTGASATTEPKFTVDANGKATLTPSGSASAGISTLNVGDNNGAYGNFYVEYTLTMTDLAAEARGFVDSFLCMGSYGNTDSNAWGANLFFDNRASQAPNNTFWARLRMSDGSVNKAYSQTFADPDIEGGKPVKIGMLVYDNTITLLINGVEAATYTGSSPYNGWFGIAQSGPAGKTTVDDFVYIPLEKELISVEFEAPEAVIQGENLAVKAIPIYNWPYGAGEGITQGVVLEGLDTSTEGEKTYFASFGGIRKQLTITVTKKPDGFRVNGPIVMTKDGKGVADITVLIGATEIETKEDVEVTVTGLDNPATGLYEGSYEITTSVYGIPRKATATRVFVVDDLSKAVTSMSDSRWTGASVATEPRFTVDANGKATLTPSGSAKAGISTLNVGANDSAYGNFYVEYTLTMTDLATEARGFVDSFLCMDSYGTSDSNAWGANLFFDNRASQAPNNTFWARLRMSDGSVNKAYSQTFADPDIEGGKPVKIGMLVYDNTITLLINGVEAATHTGASAYNGWFGIAQSGPAGKTTIDDFVYIPLGEKVVMDIKFSYPKTVLPGASVKVSAIPIYNWPYGEGEAVAEGVVVTGLDTSTYGEKEFKASYAGIEKNLKLIVGDTMFEEDFNGTLSDLTDNGWGNISKKTATLINGNLHLSGNQEGLYVTELTDSEKWADYTIKANVKLEKTDKTPNTALATIVARTTGLSDGYEWSIGIDKSGATYARLYDRGATKFLGRIDYPVEVGETYNLKLTVVGNTIKGYINGEKILETTADTSATGTVGVRRLGYNVYYDNVIVTLPEEDAPVQDVTQQQIWFTDTFESESVMTERGWDKDGTIQNGELILNNKYPTAFLTQIPGSSGWTDYTAQATITVVDSDEISPVGNSVSALIVRSLSDATGYEFGVSIQVSNDKGGFRLYNRTTSELLASTTEVVAERGKTYQLTAVVEGNRIRCFVDGQMVFDVTDTKNSNPAGYIGLRTVGYSGAYDNIVVRKVTDADRKGVFTSTNPTTPSTTSPTTGDVTTPIYIPIVAMVIAMAVVVVYLRRRFNANK